jgi:hypothetical protein
MEKLNQGDGLYKKKYHIQRVKMVENPNFSPTAKQSQVINNSDQYIEALVSVDKNAEYFVLRLDQGGKDIEHIKACRIGIHAYADAIAHHLPKLAFDLKDKYPLINKP